MRHKAITLGAIVALDAVGNYSMNGHLPWHSPGDLEQFQVGTNRTPMIMGRKTFESLPGVLPNRTHIVLSKTMPQTEHDSVHVVRDEHEAIRLVASMDTYAVLIGGAAVYLGALGAMVDQWYITRFAGEHPLSETDAVQQLPMRIQGCHALRVVDRKVYVDPAFRWRMPDGTFTEETCMPYQIQILRKAL